MGGIRSLVSMVRGRVIVLAIVTLGLSFGSIHSASSRTTQIWGSRYDGPGNGEDFAESIVVSQDGSKVMVTGSSTGIATGFDYATAAYDASTGASEWGTRYNDPGNGDDFPLSLAGSPDGSKIYVTGASAGPSGDTDVVTSAHRASDGSTLWRARYGGAGHADDSGRSVAVSPDGSRIFVAGYAVGVGTGLDYITVAYDSSTGVQGWTTTYNGPGNLDDRSVSVGVSPDGTRVFVTGYSVGATSGLDYATAAYDAATGGLVWIRRFNGSANRDDYARSLVVSPDGSKVFVTGSSYGTTIDYATVAYKATTGAFLWAQGYDGGVGSWDLGYDIAVSPDGSSVFVTGESRASNGFDDIATVSYESSSGTPQWERRYDDAQGQTDAGYSIAVSPDGSEVFVAGVANLDYITAAYGATGGDLLWASSYNGRGNGGDYATGVTVSPDGSKVFVTGTSFGGAGRMDDFATVAYDASTGIPGA